MEIPEKYIRKDRRIEWEFFIQEAIKSNMPGDMQNIIIVHLPIKVGPLKLPLEQCEEINTWGETIKGVWQKWIFKNEMHQECYYFSEVEDAVDFKLRFF